MMTTATKPQLNPNGKSYTSLKQACYRLTSLLERTYITPVRLAKHGYPVDFVASGVSSLMLDCEHIRMAEAKGKPYSFDKNPKAIYNALRLAFTDNNLFYYDDKAVGYETLGRIRLTVSRFHGLEVSLIGTIIAPVTSPNTLVSASMDWILVVNGDCQKDYFAKGEAVLHSNRTKMPYQEQHLEDIVSQEAKLADEILDAMRAEAENLEDKILYHINYP